MAQLMNALVMKIKPGNNTMLVVSEAGDFWEVPLAKPYPAVGALVQVCPQEPLNTFAQELSRQSPVNQNQGSGPAPGKKQEDMAHSPSLSPWHSLPPWQKWLPPVAAACFILLLLGGLNMLFYSADPARLAQLQQQPHQPAYQQGGAALEPAKTNQPMQLAQVQPAYIMAIDINPSLELWLDDNLSYLGAEPLNNEAADLMAKINIPKGTPLVLALEKLVAAAKDDRYLFSDQDNLILATMIKPALDNPADLIKLAEATAQAEAMLLITLAAQAVEGDVSLRAGTAEALAKAKEHQVSINKLYIAEELASRGIAVDMEEVKGEKIGRLLQQAGLPPGQVIKALQRAGKMPSAAAKISEQEIVEKVTELKNNLSAGQEQPSIKELPRPEKPKSPEKKELPQLSRPEQIAPEKSQKQVPDSKQPSHPNNVPNLPEQLPPETSIPETSIPETSIPETSKLENNAIPWPSGSKPAVPRPEISKPEVPSPAKPGLNR
jgi:hypothetical protein